MPRLQEQLGGKGASAMATQIAEEKGVLGLENPMGTDGFEFVEYTAPDPSCCATCSEDGLPRGRASTAQGCHASPPGRHQLHHQRRSRAARRAFARDARPVSACAMAFRVKDAKAAFERAVELGAKPVESDVGARRDGYPGDRGDRRVAPVLRRSLRRQGIDLRGRFRLPSGRRAGVSRNSTAG